jgi:hypothetical protein
MWLTNEEWEANNGRNVNVCSSLFAIGGEERFVQTWIALISRNALCTFTKRTTSLLLILARVLLNKCKWIEGLWYQLICNENMALRLIMRQRPVTQRNIFSHPFLLVSSSIFLWLCSPLLDLSQFFSFVILYTIGMTPWTGNQPIARPLPAHRAT